MAEAIWLVIVWTDRGVQANIAERFRVIHVDVSVRAALDDHSVDAEGGCPIEVFAVGGDRYGLAVYDVGA